MKRILSLVLALLLCCGFIVSCEKEEAPLESESSSSSSESSSSSSVESSSSSSTESSSSSSESSSSSSVESSSSSELLSDGKLTYDDRGFPVFFSPPNAYTYYNVTEKEKADSAGECYDTWVFDNYEAYCSFISQYASIGEITEDMLNEHFLVVVYRREDIRWTENYSYHSFKAGERCSLVLEYTDYGTEHTDDEYFFHFDIVLVPRSECDGSPLDIDVDLRRHIHLWK